MSKFLEACGLPCHVSVAGIEIGVLGFAVFYVACSIVFM
jgi:hypothetical protein